MVNKRYEKGKRLEQAMVRYAREQGLRGIRSAGSKTKIDCVIIDEEKKKIYFIQGKAKKMSENASKKLLDTLPPDDEYLIKSLVISDIKQFKKLLFS